MSIGIKIPPLGILYGEYRVYENLSRTCASVLFENYLGRENELIDGVGWMYFEKNSMNDCMSNIPHY